VSRVATTAISPAQLDAALASAALAGHDPDPTTLAALADEVRPIVDHLDVPALRAAVDRDPPRLVLGTHPDGPLVAVRWFEPGEVTTVHTHAWTVLVTLAGGGAIERWEEADGGARLHAADPTTAGDRTLIRTGEAHRQRAWDRGALELVLIGDYSPERPRVDLEPEAVSTRSGSLIAAFVDGYRRADADGVAALYRDDAELDVNVPHWRSTAQGRGAIADLLRIEEFRPGFELRGWRATPTPDGAAVEIECRYGDPDHPQLAREVHLLRLADSAMAQHVLYCTGIWDSATVARHRADEGV
jgi:hypothetical protein